MMRSKVARRATTRESVAAFVVVVLSLGSLSPSPAWAQERPFPYELTNKDALIAPIGMASGMLGLYLSSKVDPLSLGEINSLDRHDVNRIDQGTTHNWSPTWGTGATIPGTSCWFRPCSWRAAPPC